MWRNAESIKMLEKIDSKHKLRDLALHDGSSVIVNFLLLNTLYLQRTKGKHKRAGGTVEDTAINSSLPSVWFSSKFGPI